MDRMADALDLTEEQRARVQEITRKHMEGALGDCLETMRQARERLGAVIHDAAATDAQVQEAASAVAAQVTLVAVERHRMAVEIDGVLTPEQKQKAAALRQRRQEARHGFGWEGPDEP
jgi:Spy/CpxP family protein refolding chaperone